MDRVSFRPTERNAKRFNRKYAVDAMAAYLMRQSTTLLTKFEAVAQADRLYGQGYRPEPVSGEPLQSPSAHAEEIRKVERAASRWNRNAAVVAMAAFLIHKAGDNPLAGLDAVKAAGELYDQGYRPTPQTGEPQLNRKGESDGHAR